MDTISTIHALLDESDNYFQHRKLGKARNTAQIALEFAEKENARADIVLANLLLGKIYSCYGKYLEDSTFYPRALHFVQEAQKHNKELSDKSSCIDIQIAFGNVFLFSGLKGKTSQSYSKALSLSKEYNEIQYEVLSYCGLSQVAVEDNDFEKALKIANKALTKIQLIHADRRPLIAEVYYLLSYIYIKKKEYSRSLEYSQALLTISTSLQDVEKEIYALVDIAIVSSEKANYKIAIQYFLEALDKSKKIGFFKMTLKCLVNTGKIYAHLYNYEEALKRYLIALKEYQDNLTASQKIIIYRSIGEIYFLSDEFEEAEEYFSKGMELAINHELKDEISLNLSQLSRTYTVLERYEEALSFAKEAQSLLQKNGTVSGKQINLLNLGDIYFYQKKFDQALNLTKEGLEVADKVEDDASKIRGYQLLSSIYSVMGNYAKAFENLQAYSKSQEEFARIQRNRKFLDLQIKFAINEKQKQIEQLTKENSYQAELLEKTDQIEKQNRELRQVNEELKQFAYVVSHDLKEPLRMIGSYTQLIQRAYKSKLDESSSDYFGFVKEGVLRMNNLLEDLLHYATIGDKGEKFEELNLSDVLEVCKKNLKVQIEEAQARIYFQELPKVFSNQSMLLQLFQNLISNAIKFRKPEENPAIRIKVKNKNNYWLLSVHDNGIGISPEYRDRIFEIFQRLHPRSKYKGTGIGLAICQKIVQKHGGKMWVESQAGEGAVFYFTLPMI